MSCTPTVLWSEDTSIFNPAQNFLIGGGGRTLTKEPPFGLTL